MLFENIGSNVICFLLKLNRVNIELDVLLVNIMSIKDVVLNIISNVVCSDDINKVG